MAKTMASMKPAIYDGLVTIINMKPWYIIAMCALQHFTVCYNRIFIINKNIRYS